MSGPAKVKALKGRLKGMIAAVRAGTGAVDIAKARMDSWSAHADHAHTRALRRAILGRGAKALRQAERAGPDRPLARTA